MKGAPERTVPPPPLVTPERETRAPGRPRLPEAQPGRALRVSRWLRVGMGGHPRGGLHPGAPVAGSPHLTPAAVSGTRGSARQALRADTMRAPYVNKARAGAAAADWELALTPPRWGTRADSHCTPKHSAPPPRTEGTTFTVPDNEGLECGQRQQTNPNLPLFPTHQTCLGPPSSCGGGHMENPKILCHPPVRTSPLPGHLGGGHVESPRTLPHPLASSPEARRANCSYPGPEEGSPPGDLGPGAYGLPTWELGQEDWLINRLLPEIPASRSRSAVLGTELSGAPPLPGDPPRAWSPALRLEPRPAPGAPPLEPRPCLGTRPAPGAPPLEPRPAPGAPPHAWSPAPRLEPRPAPVVPPRAWSPALRLEPRPEPGAPPRAWNPAPRLEPRPAPGAPPCAWSPAPRLKPRSWSPTPRLKPCPAPGAPPRAWSPAPRLEPRPAPGALPCAWSPAPCLEPRPVPEAPPHAWSPALRLESRPAPEAPPPRSGKAIIIFIINIIINNNIIILSSRPSYGSWASALATVACGKVGRS
ncbi:extensin-like [Perognathus longimembris pacificus]|uniref:extensin-like n=1 Tax=Perognathus longimembris pacificus TaxID=214514 RepID=UPI0020198904|nr:extensin-like [Perognathus longimembris pacificus]